MSNELTKQAAAPLALTLPESELAEMQEAFAMNIGSGSVSEFDLPRIKVASGTALWLIPSLEGDQTAPRIEGVMVLMKDARTYYKSKQSGNNPPDCSSRDNITGIGAPGGECAKCPLAQWESGDNGAQACKQQKHIFFLRGSSMFPEIVSLPPTSLKNMRQFTLKAATQGVPYNKALVSLELEKAQGATGQVYGKCTVKFLRKLTPEEAARAVGFYEMCKAFAAKMPVGE